MKKKILFIVFLFTITFSFGQISISENFDASTTLPTDWTTAGYSGSAQAACAGNSFRDNLYSSSTSGSLTSPNIVGLSNATDLSLGFDYKIVDFANPPTVGTAAGWGEIIVEYSTDDGTTWLHIITINDANHTVSADCATNNQTILAADLPTGSDFKLRFTGNWTAGDYYIYFDNIFALQTSTDPPNCDAVLTTPTNGATDALIDGNITWSAASGIPTGYFLTVGTTSGGTDIANNVDVGYVTTYALGVLDYNTMYYVTIMPYNAIGNATGCTEESFTTVQDPNLPQTVDCAVGPINTTYCYTNNDTTRFDYVSSDGNNLNVVFNAGSVENTYDELIILDTDGTTELYNGYGNAGDLTGLTFQSTGDRITVMISSDGSVNCNGTINPEWDFDVSCATCTNQVATYTVREDDCANGSQFFIDIDITSLGTAGTLTVSDDQSSPTQNVNNIGLITFGPFTLGTDVIITIANDDDANCTINSEILTLADSTCPIIVDCAIGAVNTTYCYTNNDTTAFVFQSTDGSQLNLIFNAGGVENTYDEVIVLDSDGTTDLNVATPYGNAGDLTGLSYQSSGDTITIQINSDGSVAGCSGSRIEWDFNVSCATCTNQVATYTTYEDDCANGMQFFIDVDITDLGSATSIDVSDDQGSASQNTTATGVITMGPYPIGTDVIITTSNTDDVNCIVNSTPITITQTTCPTIVDCAVGPQNTNYCYTSNDTMRFYYQSTDGSSLRLVFTEGLVDGSDQVIVYDSDGTTELYNGNGTTGDMTGFEFESTGDSISWQIQSDGFFSCDTSGFIPLNVNVFCKTCDNQTATYNVVGSCEPNQEFTIETDITDFGTATSITVSDDQGNTPQVVTSSGVVTMGPYTANTNVVITVSNTDDVNCIINSTSLTFICPPPPNDCSIIYAGEDTVLACNTTGTDLSASFMTAGIDPDLYEINSLNSCPTPPTSGGTPTGITDDDFWSPIIDLSFNFCFFGNTYNQIVIDANGAITFDTNQALTPSGWAIGTGDLLPTPNMHLNTIFGAYHDMDIASDQNTGTIEYFILGSSPSRQFVINWNEVDQYSAACDVTTTQQIILYESSNNIDINIFEKPACTTWNGGRAIIGVQNDSGTIAFTPPGRNTGVWDITNEFYRFSPGGDDAYIFEWFEGVTSLGNSETITVNPTVETTYTASVTYTLCDGTTATITDDVIVTPEVVEADVLYDITVCDTFILPALSSTNNNYYTETNGGGTMLNAGDTVTTTQTIYIYAVSDTDPTCTDESSFEITINNIPLVDTLTNVIMCDLYTLPSLTNGNYYTETDGGGTMLNTGDTITTTQTIYIYAETGTTPNCTNETNFEITINAAPTLDTLTDVNDCDFYELPILTVGNYYTETAGGGTMLNTGDQITTSQTIFVYAETGTIPNCTNEVSFEVTINVAPIINHVTGLDSCENANGMAEFDTSMIESTVIGNQTDLTVTYTGENGDSLESPLPNPFISNEQTITITVTNTNNCSSSTTLDLVFSDISNCEIIIPDGFSPNGDGINDTFEIRNLRGRYPDFTMEFYNRWGEKIYTNDSNKEDWNGELDGKGDLVPVGVYYFILNYNDPDKEPIQDRLYISR